MQFLSLNLGSQANEGSWVLSTKRKSEMGDLRKRSGGSKMGGVLWMACTHIPFLGDYYLKIKANVVEQPYLLETSRSSALRHVFETDLR